MKMNFKKHKDTLMILGGLIALFALIYLAYGAITTLTVSSPTSNPFYTSDNTTSFTITAISDVALLNATIYGNFSGTFAANTSNTTSITNNVAFTLTTDALSDNEYNYSIRVCDTGSNCNYSYVGGQRLIIDTTNPTAPQLASTSDANNTWYTRNWVFINSTSTELYPSVCLITFDGVNYTGTYSGNVCSKNFTGQSAGTHNATAIYVNDSSGNSNSNTSLTTGGMYFYLDLASPTSIVAVSPTSSNNTLTKTNWIYLNITFTEANLDTCLLTESVVGSTTDVAMTEATGNCYINRTSLSDGVYNYTVVVNDSAGQSLTSTGFVKNITIDNTGPSIGTLTNKNITGTTDMTFQINSTLTETNSLGSCWAKVYASDGSTSSNVAGSLSSTTCYVDFTHSNVASNGRFIVGINANDSLGNAATEVNASNWTMTTLYSGWNLIHMDRNISLGNISFLAPQAITSVSAWSNTNHNYTTWVLGASTNSATAVVDGDAVYVNVNQTVRLLRFWQNDVSSRNITLTNGWNQVSFFNTTNEVLGDVCAKSIDNSSAYMHYATFVDMSQSAGSRYITKPCSLTVNKAQAVPKGLGVWVNVNATTTFGLSRN